MQIPNFKHTYFLHSLNWMDLLKRSVQASFTMIRILFGAGWLMAGITKITGKGWFSEPGVFLTEYLTSALEKPNVPEFYRSFIDQVALQHVLVFNYTIPVVQIVVGIFLILGFMTLPSVLICLFMHINFILSGNMNLISLTMYSSAFLLFMGGRHVYRISLDRYFQLEPLFALHRWTAEDITDRTEEGATPKLGRSRLQDDVKDLLQAEINEIIRSVEKTQIAQHQRLERLEHLVKESPSSVNPMYIQEKEREAAV
jgi:thiosulfate dehydrogenase [quinone] large subunit